MVARVRSTSKFPWRRLLSVIVALVLVVLSGCPGPTFVVQQYGGPQRPQEAVATLRVNGNAPVRLMFLDDQDVAAPVVEDGRLHIEVLPGRHTLVVSNANAPNERYAPMAFQAEPGRVYRVAFAAGPSGSEARIFEVDRGKDGVIRDVTQALVTEPAPARAPAPPAVAPAATPIEDAGAAPTVEDASAPMTDGG